MAIGTSQPFETNFESVAKGLAMDVAQLTIDLAMARDQIAQYAAERDARNAGPETPTAKPASKTA